MAESFARAYGIDASSAGTLPASTPYPIPAQATKFCLGTVVVDNVLS